MTDADVLLYNVVGPGFTWQTVQDEGIGGSEYEITQIAHALADRGHQVIVANGIREPVEQRGVRYIPHSQADGLKVRALYIERWSKAPRVEAARSVVRATDVCGPPYDIHMPLLVKQGGTLVCVSKWQSRGFLFPKRKIVIPPMLGDVPQIEKVPGRFVFASGPGKGLAQTLLKWRELKATYADELAAATLLIVTPGKSYADPPRISAADEAIGVSWAGSPPVAQYRRFIASAQGLFYVCGFQETFCCASAFIELAGGRNHILCLGGLGGIPEAVTNMRLVTTNHDAFAADFMAAWRNPGNPAWYASCAIPDRSPAALAPIWEDALRLN